MKEKLSALVDAELPEHERDAVLRELSRNDELRKTWERYHIARAVMRNEFESRISPDFAARLSARLEAEPVPTARTQGIRERLARGAAGLALAASVAAVAIGAVRYFGPPASPYDRLQPQQLAANAAEVIPAPEANGANDDELTAFLMEHNEFMPRPGVSGVMSYVRLAAYNNH